MNRNRQIAFAPDHPTGRSKWDDVLLYRWWMQNIVGKIDHEEVMQRVIDESGLSPRYCFMTLMSAGIAILGLLQSSPAVVIGAMLISPLMSPILGLGFALALFDFAELRRSLSALFVGILLAIAFTVLIVVFSPLKAPTAEILARTRPNLFDLLVALFSAMAGTFAVIRGRGETIVGVAIATALMPPLAVIGYGLATMNVAVLAGATALFVTNFVTIALTAMIMARLYGFGHFLSREQTWLQTAILTAAALSMAIPLAFALSQIASEAVTVREVRKFLTQQFGNQARVTQLDVVFDKSPIAVRSVVIAPRSELHSIREMEPALARRLGRAVSLQVDQILVESGSETLGAQREALRKADAANDAAQLEAGIAKLLGALAGVSPDEVTLDRQHRRAIAKARPMPEMTLASWMALETRAGANSPGWDVAIVPPLSTFPVISFADGSDVPDDEAQASLTLSFWAAKRWNMTTIGVPGLPSGDVPERPRLNERRALAVAEMVRAAGFTVMPVSGGGQQFALTIVPSQLKAP